jgi:hypothetical protein
MLNQGLDFHSGIKKEFQMRQRTRKTAYKVRRWELKAARRIRRDPDATKGIQTQYDKSLVRAQVANHKYY